MNLRSNRFCRAPLPKQGSDAFTLIEILVVVSLIGILMTLTLLSIKGGEEKRLTTAGATTVEIINNARQLARTQNTMAMVALINNDSTNPVDDKGRVLTTLLYSPETTTNGGWTQIDQWRILPTGIIVDQSTPADQYLFEPAPAATILKRGTATIKYSCVKFLPDGRPAQPSAQPRILKLKGINGPASNEYTIIVNQATGIPIIRRP